MRAFLAVALLVLVLAAAGCGGGGSSPADTTGNGEASKSAQQVVEDAVAAAKGARSFHMAGQINAGFAQIGLDLTIVKGKGAQGSMTLRGHKVELVTMGKNAYMKADADFYKAFGGSDGSAAAALIAGKWLKFSTSDPQYGQLTTIADSKGLFDSLTTGHGKLENKGTMTYKGLSAVDILDTTQGGDLYVSATGTAYPLAIVKSGKGAGGDISFDHWNDSVTLTPPSGAIDISKLAGG
ncbi:MAG: hypothetical protein QOG85_2275 [Gaiellaceae bacterium]|jgi:hypothetical protein|nr:hypothetical protein [Gaiellaceae bacterium]